MDGWMELAVLSVKTHQSVIILFWMATCIWSFLPLPSCLLYVICQHNGSSDNGVQTLRLLKGTHGVALSCTPQMCKIARRKKRASGTGSGLGHLHTKSQGLCSGHFVVLLRWKCPQSPLKISQCWKGLSESCLMALQASLIRIRMSSSDGEHTEHDGTMEYDFGINILGVLVWTAFSFVLKSARRLSRSVPAL